MSQNVASEQEKTLTSKQVQAAILLAGGTPIADVAEQIGAARRTVERWKKHPLFQEEMKKAENLIYDDSLRSLKRNAKAAIDCLLRNMNGKVSPYVQVTAAAKVLDLGLDVHRITEVIAGLNELHRRLDDADKH